MYPSEIIQKISKISSNTFQEAKPDKAHRLGFRSPEARAHKAHIFGYTKWKKWAANNSKYNTYDYDVKLIVWT